MLCFCRGQTYWMVSTLRQQWKGLCGVKIIMDKWATSLTYNIYYIQQKVPPLHLQINMSNKLLLESQFEQVDEVEWIQDVAWHKVLQNCTGSTVQNTSRIVWGLLFFRDIRWHTNSIDKLVLTHFIDNLGCKFCANLVKKCVGDLPWTKKAICNL